MAVKVRTKYDDDDEYPEPICIKGIPVHPQLLESQAVQRCDYQSCGSTCCRNGVYIDVDQSNMILEHQEAIKPFLRAEAQNPADWFDGIYDIDSDYPSGRGQGTNVISNPNHKTGSACIFLRADLKCGLQAASMELGYAPWHFKPYHCALHPLTVWEKWLLVEEELEHLGGTCLVEGPNVPLYEVFAEEIKLHLGEDGFNTLAALATAQPKGSQAAQD